MLKIRTAVFMATGALAALGVAGTALAADGADDTSASPSASMAASYDRGGAAVGVAEAKAIAIRVAGGGYVRSVERETEHGRPVWDVDLIVGGVEHDVDVDRASGEVLRHRIEGANGPAASGGATAAASASADDHGRQAEPGDDRGGASTRSRRVEPGDDNGGAGTRHAEPGDDKGGHGRGGDDRGGDDRGGRGRGSDD
ncbi:HtpX-like protease [Actinoplanes sp. SE50]|uniref:PepSY domain-containing protein n=1 Tax=unclassified Actinoplanes TaxID=2626549 RepID=UPI00023ECF0E|nr:MULTISPECIES: PepSY domain-containing protein [unclassified Actinoplanes]AEV86600.1 HtpX-like probable protease [Actinoplanes sp. SE50/110]ATO84998.1 HtpX-like protease [Actinoplanes sp. SE50]SLM02407.1 HtpX-like protease [Actinoplanes sp. SE50/110]